MMQPPGVDHNNSLWTKLNRAMMAHQAGQLSEAESLYRETLAENGDQFEALHFMGVLQSQRGNHEDAHRLISRSLEINQTIPDAYANHARVLNKLKRHPEALVACDRALALRPNSPDALTHRGNALTGLGRPEEALAAFNQVLAARPDYVEAVCNRGHALHALRRYDEALLAFDQSIALRFNLLEAHLGRGNVLLELGSHAEAMAAFDRALTLTPDCAEAHTGRGIILAESSHFDEALEAYHKALTAVPNMVEALNGLGNLYTVQSRIDEAIACYDKAIALRPELSDIASNRIFALDFKSNTGFAEHQEARRAWWERCGAALQAGPPAAYDNALDPERQLVIGYASADFRQHSAANGFEAVLTNHAKSQFQVICYSNSVQIDDVTRRFQAASDAWRSAFHLTDAALAEQIRADKIDILVDLSGHSRGHRLEVFAIKPAPVQVTAWGHATGTGLPTIDYLFSDPVAIPQDVRPLFAEQIFDLPCLITFLPPPFDLPRRPPPVLTRDALTFGCFNRSNKISNDCIRVWSEILARAPRSRLLLKDTALDDKTLCADIAARFGQHGAVAERLEFRGRTSREEHLAALNDVDICLDPFPHNGGASTWEALHMGVPVVAKLGNSLPSRLGGAILSSIGLGDWVAERDEDYVRIALGADAATLAQLRSEIPARMSASPASNPVLHTRAVEDAYRAMWRTYCARVRSSGC